MKKCLLLVGILLCVSLCACAEDYTCAACNTIHEYTGTNEAITFAEEGEHTLVFNGATVLGARNWDSHMGEWLDLCDVLTLQAPATKVTIVLKNGTTNTMTPTLGRGIRAGDVELVIRCESAGDEGHECDDTCGKLNINSADAESSGIYGQNITIMGGNIKAKVVKPILGGSITITGGNVVADALYEDNAAICGDNIMIGGGNVTATSRYVGIGAFSPGFSGKILITGGVVNAKGRECGIGSYEKMTGEVVITGGVVNAEGEACGIGSADEMAGTILITGGTVNASGDQSGIGSGVMGDMSGTITISGGTVTATGTDGNGSGIGSGFLSDFSGTVTISGGSVTAKGQRGAGIGAGDNGNMTGTVTITGGTVYASSTDGAGVGGSYGDPYEKNHGDMSGSVVVSGGTLYAVGGTNAAGVGGGMYGTMSGKLTVKGGDVTIIGGLVEAENATADYVPAVGSGYGAQAATGTVVEVDPQDDAIGAKAGYEESDAQNLPGSPWSVKTDLSQLFGGKRYLRFKSSDGPEQTDPDPTEPDPPFSAGEGNADIPKTGDSTNLMFLSVLALVSMAGLMVMMRRKNRA